MRSVIGIISLLFSIAVMASQAMAVEYWIKVEPKEIKGFVVDAEIETNIPGAIILSARLVFKPPKPDDSFIGTGFIRFNALNGKGRFTIDGCKTAEPRGFKLPNGNYDIEVFYNYMWPDNTAITTETKIDTNIKGIASVSFSIPDAGNSNSGVGSEGLRWVVENVAPGHTWDPQFWRNKFGDLEEVPYRGKEDPKIHKMYYLKSIHMTLLINESNSTIVAYRMGRANE
ncbi:MAG: hypothetical protein M0036_07945 [Desulfobacteraceae bacterium]|nr:hypothetical protein [Desulfobacteraceae bacterium]